MERKKHWILGLMIILWAWLASCAGNVEHRGTDPRLRPYPREAVDGRDYKIAILGDSISSGVNSDYGGQSVFGWVDFFRGYGGEPYPEPLEKSLESLWPDAEVNNFAKAGSTAYQWTFGSKIDPIVDYQPDLVMVFIGGNDLLAKIGDGVLTPEESLQIMEYYRSILDTLETGIPGVELILVGYYDLFDGLSQNLPPMVAHLRKISQYALEMNQAIAQEALSRGALFVDLMQPFLHHGYGSDLGDAESDPQAMVRRPLTNYDIHPNSLGHRSIAQTILTALETHAQDLR